VAISNQARKYINKKVDRTAMPGVFDLRDIFEVVDNALNDGALAEQQLVQEGHQLVFHVLTEFGHQLHIPGFEQVFQERLRQVGMTHRSLKEEQGKRS
jgi:hypothetical protein